MKKIFLFLTILLGSSFFFIPKVEAQTTQFYQAEYIPNVYVVRKKGVTRYYQQARVFRNTTTQELAYCLEPFTDFDPDASYEIQEKLASLSDETTEKIKEVVAFGYPFNGSDLVYYMATQLRIWQLVEPDYEYYFTNGLDGPKTDVYDHWFQVIDDNIKQFGTAPSYANKVYTTTVNGEVSLEIPQSNYYKDTILPTDLNFERSGDNYTFKKLQAGDYTVQVKRTFPPLSSVPMLFYYHPTSQDLVARGNREDKIYSFKIHVVDTSIHVTKVDKENGTKQASGEASLVGARFSLYKGKEKIATITFDESLEATISVSNKTVTSLPFGTYTIKEEQAGIGYLVNEEPIEITLDEQHPNIEVVLKNQVIQNKITIKKLYGNQQILQSEEGVIFEIYDKNQTLVKTVTTDKNGNCSFYLPYGYYTIHQKNSLEGYQKVDDFEVDIKEEGKEHNFTLQDNEIPHEDIPETLEEVEIEVPNTSTNSLPPFFLIGSLLGLGYVQKKIWV